MDTRAHGPHVLFISHDVVGSRMAGPGIRAAELARVLAATQPVTLIAPRPIDLDDTPFRCGSYAWGDPASLQPWLDGADVVVANGYLLQAHPELASISQPLALDLYDPVLLENLELFRHAPDNQRRAQTEQDAQLIARQLAAGDFLLCATERQRDLYIGALMAAGRITPELTDRDPTLRTLIDVVPFGLPHESPVKQQPALRGVVPGIGADDRVVLWTGGLWDWLDPQTLVRALPQVVATHLNVRVIFLAGRHPGNDHPMRAPDETRALARELGLLDRHVFFYDQWIPYERRADFLLESDIAVSLHRDHLETRYAAIRSRVLDHLWAGLPSLLSDGDPAAALLGERGSALIVPPGDAERVADALSHLLSDSALRARLGESARELAAEFTWQRVAAPLARFCRDPQRSRPALTHSTPAASLSTTHPQDSVMPDQEARLDAVRNAALAAQEQTWQIEEPSLGGGFRGRARRVLIDQLVRPFVAPMLHHQQEYNAATLRSMYALAETMDQRRSRMFDEIGALHEQIVALSERLGAIEQHLPAIREQLAEYAEQLHGLEEADTQLLELLRESAASENEAGS